jgi:hypothetical protein
MINKSAFLFMAFNFCAMLLMAQQDSAQMMKTIDKSDKVIIKRQQKEIDMMYDSVYNWRIQQKKLDDIYIPMDLFDCFKQLDKLMDDGVRERFMAFSDEEVDRRTHGSLGIWIDHKWQLTDGSRLTAYFRKMGVPHPDYMIGIIITSYHRYLHKRDLKVKEQVAFFQEKWKVEQKEMAKEMISRQNSKK